MALNKFEKQVQQKLNNREMKPSANSWDRLDAMLSVEEKPKEKGFFWINIAASFFVFTSVGYYFYNQNEAVEPLKEVPVIVEVEEKNIEIREEKIEVGSQKLEIRQEIAEARNQELEVRSQTTDNRQHLTINEQPITQNQVRITNNQQHKTYKYISPKELLAQVENTNTPNQTVVTKTNAKIKVDANVLLSNAENELNQTFRANVIKKLNKNYQELATAIANRNYEE